MQSLYIPFKHALPPLPPVSYFSHSHSSVCLSVCQFVSLIMPCLNPLLRRLVSSPASFLCNILLDWHPISESLQVLSASCRVRMDVWRVLQASLFVTSAQPQHCCEPATNIVSVSGFRCACLCCCREKLNDCEETYVSVCTCRNTYMFVYVCYDCRHISVMRCLTRSCTCMLTPTWTL